MKEIEKLIFKTILCGVSATATCHLLLHLSKKYQYDDIATIPLTIGLSSIIGIGCGINGFNFYEYMTAEDSFSFEVLGAVVPDNLSYLDFLYEQ